MKIRGIRLVCVCVRVCGCVRVCVYVRVRMMKVEYKIGIVLQSTRNLYGPMKCGGKERVR